MEILHIFWLKFLYSSRYLGNLKHLGRQKLTITFLLIKVQKFRSKTWKTDFCTKYPRPNTQSHSPAQILAPTRALSRCHSAAMWCLQPGNQPIPYPNLSNSGHTHYQTFCAASWKMISGTGTGYPGKLWNLSPSLEMFMRCPGQPALHSPVWAQGCTRWLSEVSSSLNPFVVFLHSEKC